MILSIILNLNKIYIFFIVSCIEISIQKKKNDINNLINYAIVRTFGKSNLISSQDQLLGQCSTLLGWLPSSFGEK